MRADQLAILDYLPSAYREAVMRAAQQAGGHATIPTRDELEAAARIDEPARRGGSSVGSWIDAELERKRKANAALPFLRSLAYVWQPIADNVSEDTLRLLDCTEDQIHEEAERRAHRARARQSARGELREAAGRDRGPDDGDQARERTVAWQRQELRKAIGTADQHLAMATGLVGPHSPFVSGATADRYHARQENARQWIDGRAIYDPVSGSAAALRRVVDQAAETREAQLYALTKGLEQEADRRGYDAVFLTLTLPPEYHPAPSVGDRSWTPELGPEEQRDELADRWTRVRAHARKQEIDFFGVWAKEPHKDGCPHLHAMIFCDPGDVEELERIARYQFPADGGPPEAAAEFRRFGRDDKRERASASTYMMTYIMKQQASGRDSGQLVGLHEGATCHLTERERYRAWASVMRVRRFGFIGFRPGTIRRWMAVYRAEDLPDDPQCRAAKTAMNQREWGRALLALGAFPGTARWATIYELETNGYGEQERRAAAIAPPTVAARIGEGRKVLRQDGAYFDAESGEELELQIADAELIELRPIAWELRAVQDLEAAGVSVVDSDPSRDRGAGQRPGEPPAAAAA